MAEQAAEPVTSNEQVVPEDPLAKDLWAFASKKMTQTKQQSKTLIFVGEKQCGKSSMIAKFLDQQTKEDMAETTALEFKSGLKLSGDKRVKTNIYELGGGRNFANLLEAALLGGNIANTTVCIIVDLTKPGNTVESALFWLNAVREQSQVALEALAQTNGTQLAEMQQAMREKWGSHDDREKVAASPVPIAIIGSKFDAFANQYDTQVKKQLCMALRYIAHANGCDLVFGSVKEKVPSQQYRALLMSHLFDQQLGANLEVNPSQALNIRAGQDQLGRIDEPDGAMQRRGTSMESLWQDTIERVFQRQPEQSAQQAQKILAGMSKFAEDKVDQMRRQKDEELEQYIKQTQRAKRFEAKANQVIGGAQEPKVVKMQAAAAQQDQRRQRQQFQQVPQQNQRMQMPQRRVQ